MAIMDVNFYSTSLMRTVTLKVILPVDKARGNKRAETKQEPLKCLYLLHGIFGDQGDWVSNTRIAQWAQEKNLAVIMPAGENRFYIDQEAVDEKRGKFIGEELVQVTRRMFHLSEKKEDTFIGGLSMGGYGALINGLKYRDVFGAIVALSSGLVIDQALQSKYTEEIPFRNRHYYESIFGDLEKLSGSDKDYVHLAKQANQSGEFPMLYLACGTEDFLLNENRRFHAILEKMQQEHAYVENSGSHDWEYWDKMIKKALEWLPLEKSTFGTGSGRVQD
ncbi:MAG: alpha/beta hydrolase [Anaerorhabdus sp.]